MFAVQRALANLHHVLLGYRGNNVYREVLAPWLDENAGEIDRLADFQSRTGSKWAEATGEDLCYLYAIFRVTSLLLLRDQAELAKPTVDLCRARHDEAFADFHQRLGFRIADELTFHPFYHEISCVVPATSFDAPIEIVEVVWPALMLGNLLFSRAGCIVTGGATHVIPEIANRSCLYWTYRRKDRNCRDSSHGWGSNSQWRTPHRRDYLSAAGFHFNVDGKQSLNDPACVVRELSRESMIELVRHRAFVKTRGDDSDLYPYEYRFEESHPSTK